MINVVPLITQQQAEAIAQRHMDLALNVVCWFGFDRRKEVVWGPDYNQAARDIYVEACALLGREPHPLDDKE